MHDILSGKEDTESYLKEVVDSLKAGKDTILLTNTAYDRSELELSFEAGEALGLGPVETGDKVRSIVGRLAMEILEQVKLYLLKQWLEKQKFHSLVCLVLSS